MSNQGARMLSESKFFMGYSRWRDDLGRYETWDEAVDRVMDVHRRKYAEKLSPALIEAMDFAAGMYKQKRVLGAQRVLQFGGDQLLAKNARCFNCSVSYVDRPAFFQECVYLLLCGCGVGFSVQNHHITKLPAMQSRNSGQVKVFQVPDTIEGWADAFGVLLSSYFVSDGTFPDFAGHQVHFDFSLIRPKGAMISGGFKAPGPDGLCAALIKCEALLERLVAGAGAIKMPSIVAYDFVMHMSDAVLSGGVRRSATICIFSKGDQSMMTAKTGDWYVNNPQRGRSNNSVMLIRDELTREEWADIMKSVRDFGEPGFIFSESTEFIPNPCVEIGMFPVSEGGESGFQFCNLTELNGGMCSTPEEFFAACRAGAILGTLQAGYTDFGYLTDATRQITEREALLGVSITGWMNNPGILFDEATLKHGAEIVKQMNREIAALIGIRPAARTTCAKPSGNASVLLGTASGIHGEHAPRYFRNVQINDQDEVAALIAAKNPQMIERSAWNPNGTDVVVSFPVITKPGSIYKRDLLGVKQLEFVKKAQQWWVESGTNADLCVDPRIRHNISNTISVDDWEAVEQYIFDNRAWFAGISLLAAAGDKAYCQAPFTEVHTAAEILEMYGDASIFASGLIVDGLHAFGNLWRACDTAMGFGLKLSDDSADLLKRDWVRRFEKFAANFLGGDMGATAACLKDCHNLHRWTKIEREMQPIDFAAELGAKAFVDVDTLASQGCAGGACEVTF